MNLAAASMRLCRPLLGHGKSARTIRGQLNALQAIVNGFRPAAENFWFHCSSFGEYAIARPLMQTLKARRPDARILLTFFSVTGVEALANRPTPADFVAFLPPDTPGNAVRLLDVLRPAAALFMVSEYWPAYLSELHRRHIPTFLVSALISPRSAHFKPLAGSLFRESLKAYTAIFALSEATKNFIEQRLDFRRVMLCGDPLIDNALTIAAEPWHNRLLEEFCSRGRTLIAGSISDARDIALLSAQINAHPHRHYLLVPHEPTSAHLQLLTQAIKAPWCLLSSGQIDAPVLIVDHVGSLSRLYRFGSMAYVGGGFSPQLHSVIEPAVYGLPVAFGPRMERTVVPQLLVDRHIGHIVSSPDEFSRWAEHFFAAPQAELDAIAAKAREFCQSQAGATDRIISNVLSSLQCHG